MNSPHSSADGIEAGRKCVCQNKMIGPYMTVWHGIYNCVGALFETDNKEAVVLDTAYPSGFFYESEEPLKELPNAR